MSAEYDKAAIEPEDTYRSFHGWKLECSEEQGNNEATIEAQQAIRQRVPLTSRMVHRAVAEDAWRGLSWPKSV